MPLQRRVPKFGFTNPNRVEFNGINLDSLQLLLDNGKIKDTVSISDLVDNGLVSRKEKVKILGRGELKSKLVIEAHAFSATAKAAIEALGGEAKTV